MRYFKGVPSPVKHPEFVDMVVFRENTEDIYTGIEFPNGTEANAKFKSLLKEAFPKEFAKIRFPNTRLHRLETGFRRRHRALGARGDSMVAGE